MRTAIALFALLAVLAAAPPTQAQTRSSELEKLKEKILKEFDRRLDREIKQLRRSLRRDLERSLDRHIKAILATHGKTRAPVKPTPPAKPTPPKVKAPGWLGVFLNDLEPAERKKAGIQKGGLLIQNVVAGGPAQRLGLASNDVLIKINGALVSNVDGLRLFLAKLGAGTKVTLLIARDGQQKFVKMRLGKRPAEEEMGKLVPAPAKPKPKSVPKPKPAPKPKPKPVPRPKPVPKPKPRPTQPGWLGVYLSDLNPVARKVAGIDKGGLLITKVVEGGPAARAGLRANDALLKLDGKLVQNLESLRAMLKSRGAGDVIELLVARDGVQKFMKLELGKRPTGQSVRVPVKPAPKPQPKPKPAPKPDRTRPGWLGVVLGEDYADRERPKGEPLGIEIDEVVERGPAARAGMKPGDILLEADGKALRGYESIKAVIQKSWAGKSVKFQLRRGRQVLTLSVILGTKAAKQKTSAVPERPGVFKKIEKIKKRPSSRPPTRNR